MYDHAHHRPGTIDLDEYKRFAGAVANVFSKDWNKAEAQFQACIKFLPEIPSEAWRPMAGIAINSWESWPRNLVKAVKEVFYKWKSDSKISREVIDCDQCNSVGFFSAGRNVEVKPGVKVWYWHTWRCAACANWRGVIGDMVPMNYPLQAKRDGYVIQRFSRPQGPGEFKSIDDLVKAAGAQVNTPVPRPAVQHYDEEVPF
jgi:hypothetical protein